eukprot:gb/GEZN01010528.1/.p1 GENE.gb/GEZN01010528.1/~~gb/GEZN01010528.1/.p1  ORF type:complete len:246 (+),score=46.78 gb/GEZN01010528.1/:445-1182(+)
MPANGGVSLERGNARKRKPRHQNKVAFQHRKCDPRTEKMKGLNVSIDVCDRCEEILAWKVKYMKYKHIKDPKKCATCKERAVSRAYHVLCHKCCNLKGKPQLCGKCQQPYEKKNKDGEEAEPILEQELMELLGEAQLTERVRRTVIRAWEAGKSRSAVIEAIDMAKKRRQRGEGEEEEEDGEMVIERGEKKQKLQDEVTERARTRSEIIDRPLHITPSPIGSSNAAALLRRIQASSASAMDTRSP